MDPSKNNKLTTQTTIGELAAAYFEAALAELGDERLASRVSAELIAEVMRNQR